jgi:hypothetical protein
LAVEIASSAIAPTLTEEIELGHKLIRPADLRARL